jgi:cell division protein FtsB
MVARYRPLLQNLCRILIAIAAAKVHSINMSQRTRIANLKQEREVLEEEIRQLRAAVQIYTEVARRLSGSATSQ